MGDAIPVKIVRKIIFDILIERSNIIDEACDEMVKKEIEEGLCVISDYAGELGWTACGTRVLADDILEGIMSLEEAVEVLSSEERREAKARCQNWLDEKSKNDMEKMSKILGHDCDGDEIEEFRILRFPFSAEIENWQEEPNVEPRFYCAIIGNDNKSYLISVYDDYNTEAIRKYEKMKKGEKIPTKIKNIEAASKYEVAFDEITGNAWYYDRDKNVLKERLAEIIEQEKDSER